MRQVQPPDSWNRPIRIGRPVMNTVTSIFGGALRLTTIARTASKKNLCLIDARDLVDAEIEELRREDTNTSEGGK